MRQKIHLCCGMGVGLGWRECDLNLGVFRLIMVSAREHVGCLCLVGWHALGSRIWGCGIVGGLSAACYLSPISQCPTEHVCYLLSPMCSLVIDSDAPEGQSDNFLFPVMV